jgi:hypothetical protein
VAGEVADGRQAIAAQERAIALAPSWGLVVGDLAGHIPLPAKIVFEALVPIDAKDVAAGYDDVIHEKVLANLQAGVDRLAAERRFPVIG